MWTKDAEVISIMFDIQSIPCQKDMSNRITANGDDPQTSLHIKLPSCCFQGSKARIWKNQAELEFV
ncbi:uncharacterized protein Dsimw501_GD11770 [Drosophila simulans]|uniref:GD11770 n=1 Tax=Drosophila simulans TaxID=7240 RepID=B4QIQ5_DROSI|nr:GD11770 [Drosophila simulans]KMY96044.1 uncharacterized protein Dsimw501_GD11770 [Drosophila simulans]